MSSHQQTTPEQTGPAEIRPKQMYQSRPAGVDSAKADVPEQTGRSRLGQSRCTRADRAGVDPAKANYTRADRAGVDSAKADYTRADRAGPGQGNHARENCISVFDTIDCSERQATRKIW